MTTPGESLKRWRDARDLSQQEAALMLSPPATQGAWASWENSRKPPSLGNALAIERLTGGVIRAAEWVTERKRPPKKRHPKRHGSAANTTAAKAS
jgi:transcriptional regulator with XRE-family HTH domain